jgi:guanosine-3',5'-bis(diphosphate) 3'-pyrophosphohydrolase
MPWFGALNFYMNDSLTTLSTGEVTLLLTALRLAADKHRLQRRKDREASPYINHPIEVAELLWRIGGVRDVVTLAAALLHDTLEDTSTTPLEIQQLCGSAVLALVQEVTDDKSLPKQQRKQLQVEKAHYHSTPAKYIKLADKICNVHDISHFPPQEWSQQRRQEYLEWSAQVVAGLRGINSALEAYYDTTLAEAKQILMQD